MSVHLRDGYGEVAAKRARRAAQAVGHLLERFRPSKDNADDNQLGDVFYAECMICRKPVLLLFEPFGTEDEERMAVTATSNRFGYRRSIRYYVSMPPFCRHR